MLKFLFVGALCALTALSAGEAHQLEPETGARYQAGYLCRLEGLAPGKQSGVMALLDMDEGIHLVIGLEFETQVDTAVIQLLNPAVETAIQEVLLKERHGDFMVGFALNDEEHFLVHLSDFYLDANESLKTEGQQAETLLNLVSVQPVAANLKTACLPSLIPCEGPCEAACFNSYCPAYQNCGSMWWCKVNVLQIFDACVADCDYDHDGHDNGDDLCPCDAGPNSDCDGDGIGDACDPNNTTTTTTTSTGPITTSFKRTVCGQSSINGPDAQFAEYTWSRRITTTRTVRNCATGEVTTTRSYNNEGGFCYVQTLRPCSAFDANLGAVTYVYVCP